MKKLAVCLGVLAIFWGVTWASAAGDHGTNKQAAYRYTDNIAQQDQYDARWNNLAQRTRGGDSAGCKFRLITMFQQGGQGDDAHRHHRRTHDTGCGRQQGPDYNDGHRQPASDATEQHPHGLK